ncbi:MAG: hypothetical protein IJL66_02445, partial [Lachnospiraceae bacterium]|nr:hypothetical protein [Lachnospiraceae bacterium]
SSGNAYYYPDVSKPVSIYMMVPAHTKRYWVDLSSFGGTDNGDGSYTFSLRSGESLTIRIPYGYQYTVTETDYTAEGYVTTVDDVETRSVSGIAASDESHVFVNTKNGEIPTGLGTDRGLWRLLLCSALAFGVLMLALGRRRARREEL